MRSGPPRSPAKRDGKRRHVSYRGNDAVTTIRARPGYIGDTVRDTPGMQVQVMGGLASRRHGLKNSSGRPGRAAACPIHT